MQKQPVSDAVSVQHVFITVAGGVAYVADAPETINVHIVDYDDLKADFEVTFSRMSPEARAFYLRSEELEADSPAKEA